MLRYKGIINYNHAHLCHCPAKESFLTGIVIHKIEICDLSAHQIKLVVQTASIQRSHCVQSKGNTLDKHNRNQSQLTSTQEEVLGGRTSYRLQEEVQVSLRQRLQDPWC